MHNDRLIKLLTEKYVNLHKMKLVKPKLRIRLSLEKYFVVSNGYHHIKYDVLHKISYFDLTSEVRRAPCRYS